MTFYLDNSVLNRPFDDQRQPRVWLETLCFMLILQMVEAGEAELVRSPFQAWENSENPASERRQWVDACLKLATRSVQITAKMQNRANALVKAGLKPLDAAHISAAESASADFFITCDDRLIRNYRGPLHALTPPELVLTLTKEES